MLRGREQFIGLTQRGQDMDLVVSKAGTFSRRFLMPYRDPLSRSSASLCIQHNTRSVLVASDHSIDQAPSIVSSDLIRPRLYSVDIKQQYRSAASPRVPSQSFSLRVHTSYHTMHDDKIRRQSINGACS